MDRVGRTLLSVAFDFDLDRVGRTLLSVAFDFDSDFDFDSETGKRTGPRRRDVACYVSRRRQTLSLGVGIVGGAARPALRSMHAVTWKRGASAACPERCRMGCLMLPNQPGLSPTSTRASKTRAAEAPTPPTRSARRDVNFSRQRCPSPSSRPMPRPRTITPP